MELDQSVVWITTRRIKPGTYEEFRQAWQPKDFPAGMLRAYECFSEGSNEIVGISTWDSLESRERYRTSRRRGGPPRGDGALRGVGVVRPLPRPRAQDP